MNFENVSNQELINVTRLLRSEQYRRINDAESVHKSIDLAKDFDKANSLHVFDTHHYDLIMDPVGQMEEFRRRN